MKRLLFCAIVGFIPVSGYTQPASSKVQSSWQQRVDHNISVSLDDSLHLLRGEETVSYTNNAPQALQEIWFHVYGNAYENSRSALGRQQVLNSSNKFFLASEEERGGYKALSFSADGKNLTWEYHPEYRDIVKVILPQALAPGQKLDILVNFTLKIPGQFSRFGHDGNSYQITQWFPKPAVFDVNGWNTFPYLDQGEFYYEYGRYEVRITLPASYIVAATGVLQDTLLRRKMLALADDNDWPDSAGYNTWHFVQDSIHDFAWFCDKRFKARRGTCTLLSGKKVETWVLAANRRPDSKNLDELKEALTYYSRRVGDYPYQLCTVVETALKSGGGMEYPMITNVQSLTREVIVHEVGHNWFQGMLGSQERQYPWMDEGINSYYEHLCVRYYHPSKKSNTANLFDLTSGTNQPLILSMLNTGEYLPPGLPAEAYGTMSYASIIYGHSQALLRHLEEYLGRKMFDSCMKTYFKEWAWKHPLPGNMRSVFEQVSGKNLEWWFVSLMNERSSNDYAICHVRRKQGDTGTTVTVRNRKPYTSPFQIATMNNGAVVKAVWKDGFRGKQSFTIPGKGDQVRIDPYGNTTELRRYNDLSRTKGVLRKVELPGLRVVYSSYDPLRPKMFIAPVPLAWNHYDGYMPGIALYNSGFPLKRNAFLIAPLYGLKSKKLTGYAWLKKRMPLNSQYLRFAELGLKASRFSYAPGMASEALNTYRRLNPYLEIGLNGAAQHRQQRRSLVFEGTRIFSERTRYAVVDSIGVSDYVFPAYVRARYLMASYRFQNLVSLKPVFGFVNLEYGRSDRGNDAYLKTSAYYLRKIPYHKKDKGFVFSLFGGAMLYEENALNTSAVHLLNLFGNSGSRDYMFRQTMTRRSEPLRNSFNMQLPDVGGLRTTAMPVLSNSFVLGLNSETSIPGPLPLSAYMDAGVSSLSNGDLKGYYVGGLCLSTRVFGQDLFTLNFPLLQSSALTQFYSDNGMKGYGYRISCKFNLNLFQPASFVHTGLGL
ncbi:MAG: M1 family metallopeptidase [Bacteroidetes bacterium]|nr:M1 family metallopeptidase [Bacteroidota bacterium]